MTRGLIILSVVGALFWIYSIADCSAQPATRHRGVSKPVWMAITILLPVVGGILWFMIGRTRKGNMIEPSVAVGHATKISAAEEERRARVQEETDARIADLEEQLRQLDEEEAKERERLEGGADSDADPDATPDAAPDAEKNGG